MRSIIAVVGAGLVASMATSHASQQAGTGNCVPIGTPQPTRVFSYQFQVSPGGTSNTTAQWESVTKTGSRVKTSGPAGVEIQVNTHHIVDDVAVLTLTMKTGAKGGLISSTEFSPGVVSDPAFRACAGRSWTIPAVTASYRSASGQGGSTQTPSGTLRIVAIHEKVTVPAGTFETVHYVRSTAQSNDEYWKSIEHGVVVKHLATARGAGTVSETLTAIK